jgi:hypothetical protein
MTWKELLALAEKGETWPGGKAASFRYLLPLTEGAPVDDF